jgi:hypothetical protein
MSIVPEGFHCVAHTVFAVYTPPKFKETSSSSSKDVQALPSCAICLTAISDPTTLVACTHSFCYECISQWLRKSNKCPLCKSKSSAFIRSSQDSNAQLLIYRHPKERRDRSDNTSEDDKCNAAVSVHRSRFEFDHSRGRKLKRDGGK